MSVCLSLRRVDWIVTKRKKNLSRFLYWYHMKEHLAQFSQKKNGCWGRPLLPEILGQTDRIGVRFSVDIHS